MAVLYGTSGNDWIGAGDGATNGADQIFGFGGHDSLYGWGGDDSIWGGGGEDDLVGQEGNDVLWGGDDADRLIGQEGNDTLSGGAGADVIYGDYAPEFGELGIDTASYAESDAGVTVNLATGQGSGGHAEGDTLYTIENLTGSAHSDYLTGDDGANQLYGWGGNDLLKGGGGADGLEGGTGNDSLKGGGGADMLSGGADHDTLNGGEEHDWLYGGDGNDYLDGGAGDDFLSGSLGNDTYIVDNVGDWVAESAGQGQDEVRASTSWIMPAGADIETLRTTDDAGTGVISLSGNASGNVVRGNNGSNVLNGGNGRDFLTGLGGTDSFLFDTPLSAAFNVDIITDFNVAADTIRLDDDIFSSSLTPFNSVAGSQFVIGAAAQDAGDRIIYSSATGEVYYDSDGTGPAAQIQFATLSAGLALTNFDFLVVA
jgi:Ca2+-binding RTX toxin-like protein